MFFSAFGTEPCHLYLPAPLTMKTRLQLHRSGERNQQRPGCCSQHSTQAVTSCLTVPTCYIGTPGWRRKHPPGGRKDSTEFLWYLYPLSSSGEQTEAENWLSGERVINVIFVIYIIYNKHEQVYLLPNPFTKTKGFFLKKSFDIMTYKMHTQSVHNKNVQLN